MIDRRNLLESLGVLAAGGVLLAAALPARAETAFDFGFTSIDGAPMPMTAFAGKVVMVVNTASFCGFTYQYEQLQALWTRYRDRGLVVVGAPSNDFGGQEPGKAGEIKQFCEVNFGIDFPMTEKVHVRGANAHPFWDWTRATLGKDGDPGWNFHKILIGRDGAPLAGFPSRTEPTSKSLIDAVEQALG